MIDLESPITGPIVVALSGGMDSALLLALLAKRGTVYSAHIDHGLRDSSVEDAAFCRRLAASMNLAHLEACLELSGRTSQHHARYARYAALGRLADSVGAEVIATAHHFDDQLESLLMARDRGATWSPMQQWTEFEIAGKTIWRPLLDVSRAEIERQARDREVPWVEDPTNQTDKYERNRARKRISGDSELRSELARSVRAFEPPPKIEFRRVSSMRVEADRDEVEAIGAAALADLVDAVPGASIARRTLEDAVQHLEDASRVSLSARGAAVVLGRDTVLVERSFGRGRTFLESRDADVATIRAGNAAEFDWFEFRIEIESQAADLHVRSPANGDRMWDGTHTLQIHELMRSRGIEACDRWKVPVVCSSAGILAVGDLRAGPDAVGISVTRRNV